jgi:cell division protein FtsQ
MSETWLYGEETELAERAPRIERESVVKTVASKPQVERFIKRLAIVLGVALGLEIVWFCAIVPFLPFSSVTVAYSGKIPRAELLAAAGIHAKSSWINCDAAQAKQALEALPSIASAVVLKRFPDRLAVQLTERSAIAVTFAELDGRVVPLSFDREGVVFQIGQGPRASVPLGANALPVVSGLVFERAQEGTRLPDFLGDFLSDLERLERTSPALLASISEIRIQKKAYESYDLVLYPVKPRVRVRIGSRLNEETLQYMMLVLDVLSSRGIRTDEIDFRTGTAVYREKEASSG